MIIARYRETLVNVILSTINAPHLFFIENGEHSPEVKSLLEQYCPSTLSYGIYQHSKNGKFYEVLGIALNSNLEEFVVYQAQYHDSEFGTKPIWLRTRDDFFEVKIVEGVSLPRFQYIS